MRWYHFNIVYWKEKNNCIYSHNTEECPSNCKRTTCVLRHKKKCKDGEYCFYYQNNNCEFNHENEIKLDNEKDKLKEEILNLKK